MAKAVEFPCRGVSLGVRCERRLELVPERRFSDGFDHPVAQDAESIRHSAFSQRQKPSCRRSSFVSAVT